MEIKLKIQLESLNNALIYVMRHEMIFLPLANGTASDDSHNNARSPSSSMSCSECVGSCSISRIKGGGNLVR